MKNCTLNIFMALLLVVPLSSAFSQEKTPKIIHDNLSSANDNKSRGYGDRSLIFSEDFSGEVGLPVGWSIVGSGQNAWTIASSSSAGGAAPEMVLSSSPSFTGNSKLVTPKIITSTHDVLILQFNHFVHNYGSGYTVLVETTSDGVNWHEVWSVNITATINPETVFILINNEDVGSDNFQIAFTFNGNSSKIFSWNIDNIKLNENLLHDAEATNVFVPSLAGNNDNISPIGIVTNKGLENISFDAVVEIIDNESAVVYTSTMTVANLPSFESKVLTFPAWNSSVGNYTVNLTTILAGDENSENDLISASMEIQENVLFKKPLYEEFTSSTCGPCGLQNPVLDAVLAANPTTHSLVKYQVGFPSAGDPFYTSECGVRSDYYNNEAAPKVYINSIPKTVGFISQTIYDSFIGLPAKMDIDIVTASIDQDLNVNIEVNINVIDNFAAGLKAHIVIVEKTTTGNVATNGETEFNNVMMKMLPNANGTTLGALSIGNAVSLTESYNMNLTFMEELTDLAVIVFVQDNNDKNVLQSEMMDISISTEIENKFNSRNTVNLFPNPANGIISLDSDLEIEQIIIFNLMGKIVYELARPANTINIDISNLESGVYLFKVISSEGSIVKQIIVQ